MLSTSFVPSAEYDLIRVGRDNDGGYLICPESINKSDVLVSMGISTDWSFEKDFVSMHDVPVHAFDHTISTSVLVKLLFMSFIRLLLFRSKPRSFMDHLTILVDYNNFFRGKIYHHPKMIGYDVTNSISLRSIVSELALNGEIFLKIDIEGSEYRILDQILDLSDRLASVVIEFHDIDLHRNRINNFIDQFDLILVHVHQNNCSGFDCNDDPLVIEMTFSKYFTVVSDSPKLPHNLDQPNSPTSIDLPLHYSVKG